MKPTALEQASASLQVTPLATLGVSIALLVAAIAQVITPFGELSSTAALVAVFCGALLYLQADSITAVATEKAKKRLRNQYPH